jgi:hypothetical protein
VLDEITHSLGAKTDDGKSTSEALQDDLSERLGPARESKNVCTSIGSRELLPLPVAHEDGVEPVFRAQRLQLGPRRSITNKDELARRPRSILARLLQSLERLDEQAKVLLP